MADTNVGIWGWDYAIAPLLPDWHKVHLDSITGNLQIDVITSGLPLGGATAANQALIIVDTGALVTEQGRCYGWDGADWQTLLVEDDTDFNLRAKLYDGANGIDSQLVDLGMTTQRGLAVSAAVCGYVAGNDVRNVWARVNEGDAALNDMVGLLTINRLYGYNGTTWDRLRVESDTAFNLRVRLYGGANAVLVGQSSAALAYTNYGIETFAILYGDDGTNLSRVGMLLAGADAVDNALNTLGTASMLYGYNGTTWDRLRMESDALHNLRVKLYDGANGIQAMTGTGYAGVDNYRLLTAALVFGFDNTDFRAVFAFNTDEDNTSTGKASLLTFSHLYGFNGTSWDRLRTFGVGVLAVGRAPIGLLDVRLTAAGPVGVPGARRLYWMLLNPSAGNSIVELTDAIAAGAAIKADHFDTTRDGHMVTFDPPLEFSTGLYLETFANMTSITFGYL